MAGLTELTLFSCEEAGHLGYTAYRGIFGGWGEHVQLCRACGEHRRGYCKNGQTIEWEEWGFMDRTAVVEGIKLRNVHDQKKCRGRACVIHGQTDHHMRGWTLLWRDDRGIFERICPDHGTGHPDPDQFDYWDITGQEWQGVHGCCGCCGVSQEGLINDEAEE